MSSHPSPTDVSPVAANPSPGAPGPPLSESSLLADALAHLDRAAALIGRGGPTLGVLYSLGMLAAGTQVEEPLVRIRVVLDGLLVGGCWTLGGLTAAALLRSLGRWLLARSGRWPAVSAGPLPPSSVQIETAAESPEPARAAPALETLREQAFAEVRHAIRSGHWVDAREKLDALAADQAEPARVETLNRELQSAREAAREQHLAGLHAARSVNDPDRVLELHQFLVPLLEDEARRELEAELSSWFLRLIHNRLRTGRIQTELAQLASRIAEAFSHTTEGASLRASLPTLRRSAGLCPRCAQPYTGVADACPACLARAHVPVRPAPAPDPAPDPDPASESPDSPGDSWLNAGA